MNYLAHYERLIETRRARIREIGQYYEKHHIVPRSMGGTDEDSNTVYLTAREHFIAHWLLWRIHRNRSMAFAFFAMCSWKKKGRIETSSRSYSEAREAVSQTIGKRSEETKRKCSESRIAHEIRWRMLLSEDEAESRIEEYRRKLSEGGKKHHRERDHSRSRFSEDARQRMNKGKLGVALTDEHKEKLRIKSQRKGRKLQLVKCPHCEKTGKGGNMTRYHFSNCKKK